MSVVSYGGTYGGGDGNDITPYEIKDTNDWQELMADSNDWDKHFIMTSDIDMNGLAMTPVGNEITVFSGVFDGNGRIISNVEINESVSDNVGLFGRNSGTVENLGVEDVNITGRNNVGGLCGNNWGTITGCYAAGVVDGNITDWSYSGIGGLVGKNSVLASVINCYADVAVTGSIGLNNPGGIGGLVGSNHQCNVNNCCAVGAVSGNKHVGGLVGTNLSDESSDVGGITGCFWDVQTTGQATSADVGAIGLTTAAMYNPEPYLRAFWDFKGEILNDINDVWAMPPGGGYPVLAWQIDESGVPNDEMDGAIAITAGDANSGTTTSATGLDITVNGYNDMSDVWYYFDCTDTNEYTITLDSNDFDTTLGVFDETQREVAFNDDFYGKVSVVILKAEASKRYYLRAAGHDGQTGDFTLTVTQGAIPAIHGDLNYDGLVNFGDFAIFANQWLTGL